MLDIATIHFDYVSTKGEKTSRTVDVKTFSQFGFEGNCHLRNAYKSFSFKRTENCVDTHNGETIVDIFSFLFNKLKQYKCKNSIEEVEKFSNVERDFIGILVFIGKFSGQLITKKKNIIADACCELHGDRFIGLHDIDFGNGFFDMNTDSFNKAVDILNGSDGKRFGIIIKYAEKLASVPKNPWMEKAAVDYLKSIKYT